MKRNINTKIQRHNMNERLERIHTEEDGKESCCCRDQLYYILSSKSEYNSVLLLINPSFWKVFKFLTSVVVIEKFVFVKLYLRGGDRAYDLSVKWKSWGNVSSVLLEEWCVYARIFKHT